MNESDLLEFALRLATYPNDPSTQNAQILPGQIPDQLPTDIPFPEGSRILGSLIRNPESVNTYPGKRNMTDVRLILDMNSPLPPGPYSRVRSHRSRQTIILLPTVESPEGANLIFHGGGYTGKSAHAEANLETNSDLTTLAAHYRAQLEQSGCVITEEGQGGLLAWINWTLKDDEKQRQGILIILKELDQEYYIHLRMKSPI
jgi:hypothetical protein